MNETIFKHYLEFSAYTFPSFFEESLMNDLPADIHQIGILVRKNFIHPSTLTGGNTGTNADMKFGDMTTMPWWRQKEDDILVTVPAMIAELYRRDVRGFIHDRDAKDKLVLSCRFIAIMMASILKAKGIPARVRAGHAPYFDMGSLGKISVDHWINQYWDNNGNRWVNIDVDGSLSLNAIFDPYDMPSRKFDFPADAWLSSRAGDVNPDYFYNTKPERGLIVVLWSLIYDFHCLMNDEIIYTHVSEYGSYEKFKHLTSSEYEKIDNLALLMQNPDENFDALKKIWEEEKEFRLLVGGLL